MKAAKGGGPVQVRFLEQGSDVNNFNRHEYTMPATNGGDPWRKLFTCLRETGQDCPGCNAGLKLKLRAVFNVIQRNRPQLRKDKDGRAIKIGNDYVVDGYADEVVILDVPSTTAEELRKIDGDYQGLGSRDFVLSESGSTFQPWGIRPADVNSGAQPMSEADIALYHTKRHDLDEFMKPPSAQEAQSIVQRYGLNSGQGGGNAFPAAGGFGGNGAQGNAGQAPAGNGFLQGADPAAVAAATQGGAFGAAQGFPPAPVAPAPPAPAAPAPPVAPAPPAAPVAPAPAAVPPVDPGYPPAQIPTDQTAQAPPTAAPAPPAQG